MQVRDLIEQLQRCDQSAEVAVLSGDEEYLIERLRPTEQNNRRKICIDIGTVKSDALKDSEEENVDLTKANVKLRDLLERLDELLQTGHTINKDSEISKEIEDLL